MLVLISGRDAGGEKRENTEGRPAGAEWQMLETRLIRRHGTGEAVRSGEKHWWQTFTGGKHAQQMSNDGTVSLVCFTLRLLI